MRRLRARAPHHATGWLAATLVLLTLPALATSPTRDTTPEPSLLKPLNALANGAGDHATMVASFEDGSDFHGWTKIRIEKGKVTVSHSGHGNLKPTSYEGAVRPAECQQLARLVVKGKLWTVTATRKQPFPDETRPRITIGVRGGAKIRVEGWAGDMKGQPAFASVRTHLLAIATRISDGKVTY